MQITRQTEYAIKTMLELARNEDDKYLSSKFISKQQDIPEDFLKKTIKLLAVADLVVTQRGSQGGVKLARSAQTINLAQIIKAIEGPIALNICLGPGYKCPNQPGCTISAALAKAQVAMLKVLEGQILSDMI
ncbi:MAG TPA: Rrf2 family transcriptional regulator [Syntrophomonadaceae bacterium]|nr:Rrf2 family transcriptional regulator [Syntrophomonadaceae bacterium]